MSEWINARDQMPPAPSLIVKRWKSGSVWAGMYRGTTKESGFDSWMSLEDANHDVNQTKGNNRV